MRGQIARYSDYDGLYYQRFLDDRLPPVVLDFHAHTWRREDFREVPWQTGAKGGKYMVVETEYPVDQLVADGALLFPGRRYQAVCFGMPTPAADPDVTNAYLATVSNPDLHPLMIIGGEPRSEDTIRRELDAGGFWGYKVFLPWFGNDYADIRVWDMLSEEALAVADERRLVVLLHVPGGERLAHPQTQADVREMALRYPSAQFVLAHCGRCYLPREMLAAVGSIEDVENVYLDSSMVMDVAALVTILRRVDSRRLLFATDLPVPKMRGSRVSVGTHWVDVVLDEGYPASAYRVAGEFDATFMAYEIVNAILLAGEVAGVSREAIEATFYANGRAVLDRVQRAMGGGPG